MKQEIEIEPGLKYTEETGRLQRSLPVRDCFLWLDGLDEPISGLNLLSFRQRFGAISIPSEGIGGVETLPQFRREGYMGQLMNKALEGVAKRVKVVFVSEAIEEVYEKFGFVNCLAEAYLCLEVGNVESMAGNRKKAPDNSLRSFSEDDLPAMVNLYNEEHAHRSWTHERQAGWNRLSETQTWQPGSEVIVLEGVGGLLGYAILTEQQFGRSTSTFVVDELTARDIEAAQTLLIEVASRCWKVRFSDFRVLEPLDSTVGRAAQALGCDYHQTFPASGGMMGAILDRPGLLKELEPELKRRLTTGEPSAAYAKAFEALCQGEIVPDDHALLQLLLGSRSLSDELAIDLEIPAEYAQVCAAWFPGGRSNSLSLPYSHKLDRY